MTKYNFGEKAKEKIKERQKDGMDKWVELDVYQTPKYKQSKAKAIELIESGKYQLEEGDFWILMNKGGSKMCYTGLIISHNGVLKINDIIDKESRFKPECVDIYKDEGGNIIMRYISQEQGIYEFGEVSQKNCRNEYPYAMALKRLQDRVILKTSKIAFFGIYSDSESEEFKEKIEDKEEKNKFFREPKGEMAGLAQAADESLKEAKIQKKELDRKKIEAKFAEIKAAIEACSSFEEIEKLLKTEEKSINYFKKNAQDLHEMIIGCKNAMKEILTKKEGE